MIACVGGGSNAIGIFTAFVDDADVELVGVEAAGEGIETGRHGAPLTAAGLPGVLHGAYSAVMQDEDGQILEAHSISAGLDYPGSGPEHAWLRDPGRARYVAVTDAQALDGVRAAGAARGDHPGARERARARLGARRLEASELDLVCLSGRGDKDLDEALRAARPRGRGGERGAGDADRDRRRADRRGVRVGAAPTVAAPR